MKTIFNNNNEKDSEIKLEKSEKYLLIGNECKKVNLNEIPIKDKDNKNLSNL